CARSIAERRTVGSSDSISTARKPLSAPPPTARANWSAGTCFTSQPSKSRTASLSSCGSMSVSRMESLITDSPNRSRRLGALHLEVALDRRGKRRKIERLLDVVVGARLQRLVFVAELVERGDHDDPNRSPERGMLLHHAADFPAVAA